MRTSGDRRSRMFNGPVFFAKRKPNELENLRIIDASSGKYLNCTRVDGSPQCLLDGPRPSRAGGRGVVD